MMLKLQPKHTASSAPSGTREGSLGTTPKTSTRWKSAKVYLLNSPLVRVIKHVFWRKTNKPSLPLSRESTLLTTEESNVCYSTEASYSFGADCAPSYPTGMRPIGNQLPGRAKLQTAHRVSNIMPTVKEEEGEASQSVD